MPNDFRVGEDWTDSDKNFSTTGTLASGSQTVTGDVDASGTITGATLMQGVNQVLDDSDLIDNGGVIIDSSDIVNAGPSAPVAPFAGMLWFDSANHLLKLRNEANSAWLSIWDLTNNKPIITNLTDEVLGTMLADAVAGAGLIKDGSENLAVQVDDSTIEINTDTLRVKDAGITTAKLANGNAQVSVSSNDTTPGRLNGKLVAGNNISLTENNDAGNETLTVERKFRGALVSMSADQALTDGGGFTVLDWDTEVYDTDSFHEGITNPGRFTVGSGISYVRITLFISFNNPTASVDNLIDLWIYKNGSPVYIGYPHAAISDHPFTKGDGLPFFSLSSAPISVSENDYIDIRIGWTDSTGSEDLHISNAYSWFSIEVIE